MIPKNDLIDSYFRIGGIQAFVVDSRKHNPSCYLLLPKANRTRFLSETWTHGSAHQNHAAAKEARNVEEGSRQIWVEYSLCADDGKVCLTTSGSSHPYICIHTAGPEHITAVLVSASIYSFYVLLELDPADETSQGAPLLRLLASQCMYL